MLIGIGVFLAISLALTPKVIDYLNQGPTETRELEQQIQYNDSLIKNYPYANLYIIEKPRGENWNKFISNIKSRNPITILYCSEHCIPCIYAKEHFICIARMNKNKLFFIVDYPRSGWWELRDSLENYDFSESSFPTLVRYRNDKKEKLDCTRYGFFITALKEKISF